MTEQELIKLIWRRAYLDTEEHHIQLIKEYAKQYAEQRNAELEAEVQRLKKNNDEIIMDSIAKHERIQELEKSIDTIKPEQKGMRIYKSKPVDFHELNKIKDELK